MAKEYDRQEIIDRTRENVPAELQEEAAAIGATILANDQGGFQLVDSETGMTLIPDENGNGFTLDEIKARIKEG